MIKHNIVMLLSLTSCRNPSPEALRAVMKHPQVLCSVGSFSLTTAGTAEGGNCLYARHLAQNLAHNRLLVNIS